MENRLTRLFKITIAIFAILLLGVIGGFVTTVGAEVPEKAAIINMESDTKLEITPEGYKTGKGNLVAHTDEYILMGNANTDISFKNNTDTQVTYNVTLHNFHAVSKLWHGCVSIETGVTLNLTVYGENELMAYNHAGITVNNSGNGLETNLNITVMENSGVKIGSQYINTPDCIRGNLNITILQGSSDIDIENEEGWQTTNEVINFTNGEVNSHQYDYRMYNDDYCEMYCAECGMFSLLVLHDFDAVVIDEDHYINVCTLCDAEAILKHTNEENEVKLFVSFENAINYAMENGGTLQLQCDYNANRKSINCKNVDYTFDFNGYTLDGSNLGIYSLKYTGTLTVTDTSENKTGRLSNNGISNTAYGGRFIINYIYIGATVNVDGGEIILNNLNQNNVCINLYEGIIELNNSTIDGLRLYLNGGEIRIKGGSFGEITMEKEGFTVAAALCNGYAYYRNGELVSGNVMSIENVTVEEHTHLKDGNTIYNSNGKSHITICACGNPHDGAEWENHTLGESTLCSVCGMELMLELTEGENKLYFTDVNSAVDYANNVEASTIKLLRDAKFNELYIYSDITLDLNGYSLLQKDDRINVYGKLTVCDGSGEQTGFLSSGDDISYVIEVKDQGSLVVNGGEIFGLIYTGIYGSDETARIEINGGKFTGTEKFRLQQGATLVINGGWFENKDSTIDYWLSSGINVTINGGTFVNCTLISKNSTYLPTASELLGTAIDCELTFVDEYGNEIDSHSLSEYYEGRRIVSHRGATFESDENGHSLLCIKCEKTIYFNEHYSLVYAENEDNKATHTIVCGICAEIVGAEAHTGGEANCTELAICEYCEAEYGSVNADSHTGGEATCINKAVCERCDNPYGELNESNHKTNEYEYVQGENADEHNKIYACCGAIIDTGKHENGVADCTSRGICTVCDLEYGNAPSGHTYSNKCDASCNNCGEGREISGHVYENACDTECNECRIVREINHTYGVDGKCILCGLDGGTPQAEPKESMGAGEIIGITIAALVVFGGGSFALIWFVILKKSLADLIKRNKK